MSPRHAEAPARRPGPQLPSLGSGRAGAGNASTVPRLVEEAAYDLRAAALAYARDGWAVFPLRARSKVPATAHGLKAATTAPAVIREWWTRWPAANIGVACGASGLVALDVDLPEGLHSLARVVRAGRRLPPSLSQLTGRGTQHVYQAPPWPLRNTAGTLPGWEGDLPGIDLRAAGGYFVAPPSVHPSGRRYEWLRRWPQEAAPCPEWLREPEPTLRQPPARRPSASMVTDDGRRLYAEAALRDEVEAVRRARVGTRNAQLNRSAFSLGQLVAGGLLDGSTVASYLLGAALQAGLGDRESRATIASGLRAGAGAPREVG